MRLPIYPIFSKTFEDPQVLKELDVIFKQERHASFSMPEKGSPVIFAVSGGLDSISIWNMLLSKYQLSVYPIHFTNSEHIHKAQLRSSTFFSQYFLDKFPDLSHPLHVMKSYSNFKLTEALNEKMLRKDLSLIVPNLVFHKNENLIKVSLIHSPSRLGMIMFNAYDYACYLRYIKGNIVKTILVGITPEDQSLVRESTLTVLRSINLSMCLIAGDFEIQFSAPVEKKAGFYLPRKILLHYAQKTRLPLEKSWSCAYDGLFQCGSCPKCNFRKISFSAISAKDKTLYSFIGLPFDVIKLKFGKILKTNFLHILNKILPLKKQQYQLFTDQISFKNKYFTVNKRIIWTIYQEKLYLLNPRTGTIEIVNGTGMFLWEHLAKKPMTFSQLSSLLLKKFHIPENRAHNDVKKYIISLMKKEYIVYEKK